jgi:phthiocerol/phenolphthiocerol synthesis type-I polyketide synthase E
MHGESGLNKVIGYQDESGLAAKRWSDGIAIIGMSARFPRSRNVQEYWERLLAGESLISDFTEEELRSEGVDAGTLSSLDYVRRGNTIDEADSLDAEFFGLSKRDAEIMDPQQRVFLECAWEAMEHSGYTGDGERVGVFAGVGMNTYILQLLSNPALIASAGGYQLMLANDKDFLATRVAYKLNLRGPAVAVQTACSTSLAAVHLACQSMLAGECDMALAGGVSIPFPQGVGYIYRPGMILSPDGYCRPFDASARGTVPGRGAGVVLLKKLSQAIADEDYIYAVIRGSAWNNDGAQKIGYTAPSIDGQAAVIRQALAAAGVSANRIGYVEAHGTATELGDPIEVAALTSVFAEGDTRPGSCVLGAVKGNMGHADVAAGVAGLIKAALSTQTGIIPPTPNFRSANPSLELKKGPFKVSTIALPWPEQREGERWAGVSSFGIGGTNVHVVLSSGPERPDHPRSLQPRIFPVSARTATALSSACRRLADHLESNPSLAVEDVASTLQLGRREFSHRRAFIAHDCLDLTALLRKPFKSRDNPAPQLARDVVFLFPGQGQQFVGMAEGLYQTDSAFRRTIDDGAAILRDECGFDALDFIVGNDKTLSLKERLKETNIAQPVLLLVEYALASRWRSLGVEPAALLGHSLGELTAATVAGVFSFEDGLRLAAERGRLMAQTPPGMMLAVMLPPARLADYFEEDLWLAAENGPKMSVASGTVDAVKHLERRLEADRIASVRLASKNAFHTPLMAEAAKSFRQKVESVPRHVPSIPWLSNVTGTWIEAAEAQSPQYWGSQILARVRFTQNLTVLTERDRLLLEVGPGEALIGIARQQMAQSVMVPSLGAENRRKSDYEIFLEAVAKTWECGSFVSWGAMQPGMRTRRVALPTYPFERKRYWIEPAVRDEATALRPQPSEGPLSNVPQGIKRNEIASWFYAPSWQSTPPASIALTKSEEKVECWLVLLDGFGLGEALAAHLKDKGAEVIAVNVADRFAHSDGCFSVNPATFEDFQQLWQGIQNQGLRPTGLLNLWTMSGIDVSAYDSLVLLLQAARSHRQRFRQIEILTDCLESVAGEMTDGVQRAEVLGLARVIPAEYAGTQCRSIDLDFSDLRSKDEFGQVIQQLLDEITAPGPGLSVAYRKGTRWQKGWTPAPLREGSDIVFRRGGVYLITGGVGGIGYSIARYLLRHYEARVLLTGRTPLPPRSEWAAWAAAHDSNEPVTRRILRMQELEASGGEVRFLSADVSSREAMTDVFAHIHEHFGKIDGVFHAAGMPGGRMIASQDIGEAGDVRRPKVQGSLVLAELLRGENPDFFILCSSVSAVFPTAGQGAYAAANLFQNYFADYCRRTLKLPAVAIGFDAWQEVGMAAEMVLPAGFESVKEDRLKTAMNTEEGIEVIRRVLTQWRGSQILTTTVPLETLLDQKPHAPAPDPYEDHSPQVDDTELAAILEIWKELLGADGITPADNFFELGGHSLMGTMVAARIRDRFGVVLTLRTLFEAPTPQALAEVVRASREAIVADPVPETVPAEDREEFEI